VGINQIDEVVGDAAPIELKEQSHDEIRNAAENKNTFPVGALVYNEEMPNVFTTVIDNGGYGFSIATVNEKTGRLENVPISNDAKEGWKTLNLSEGNVLQTNLSKFEIISNEGNGNLIVSIDGGEAVRMGTAELSERLQYEGFNLSSYIENESKKAEQKEQTPEQLQKEQTPEQLQEEEDDQYSDADLYATVKALYKKREKQEKIANNPIDLTDQKAIKARETAKKNVELLTEELAKWQAIINKRDERKKAEREKQNAISEERRAAIEAERIKQKELERIEREKAQGVPDVSVDNAEDARKRGYRIETGRMVERQQPQYGLIGNEREVVFSSKDKVTGKYKVVEAETLQESHINGKRNTKFFLTEAQPKERTDKASQMAAQKIAENLNPKQITEGTTAYVGTPITNTRGEIIQGNNRTSALKYMYSQAPEKSAEYKQFLIDNADSFGLNSEEIAAMKNPVLVTEIDVTDEEAIRLGQKNAQDTESGGIQRIDSEKTAKSLGDGLYQFTSRLMQSNDEEQSLSSTIEQNGRDALKILLSKNLINETQYQSAFNNKGELTPEAKEDLAGIVESIVFANSKNDNIKTMFNSLPQAAKKAILQTVARDAFNSEDVKVVPYIQEAIEIYYSLSLDTVFASAKTIEDVRKAAWSWSIQSQTDFVGNLFFPSQKYTNFALELAVMFKSQTMATQRAKFNELYDKLQGVGGDMFSETELLPFRDAVEKIYNVKLNKELGHVTNDGSHVLEVGSELGEERERGGTRGTRGDEQATSGARSADNREGVAGDNRQGTSNRQTKEEMSEKRAIAEGVTKKLNIDIEFVENPDELPDSEIKARRAIQEGEKVGGWYNPKTNKAYLYIPNVTTANEVEKTILHEVVAHKGLRGLLGKEQFNALCDSVWQQMTGKERLYWTEYVLGVKTGQAHPLDIARAIGSQANRRAAADEFMANMAENGIENKTAWQKIVEFVKDALRKMGFGKAFTDRELIEKDIKKLLSKSYKRQTRNKENSITNEKESDVRFRFVDNTEYIKDDLEEEKNKYGGKRYKIVGDDIIVSTYFVVENSDQYSEIRYASASFDKALDYAKDYYDNDIDSDYVTIDLESIERAIPISEFKENNEEIWGNSFNEFEGSLENYIDTYIDDYLDNAGVDVGYETDEEPVRFVIQKGERDNKYTDKLIWDVEDEIERRFGVKVGKYSSFYVNREGNITDAYEDEQGRENLSVTMRISDHTHNPANGKDDLNVLIADKDATSRRFFTSTEDLVFNSDYTADEIVDEIEEYWRNYARDNYNGDELDIRFRTTAYHGSPHKVDKFSTDYIGTGEGAQAFGWGLYFTSIKDIAKEYATMRKGGVGKNLPVIDNINRALKERGIKEYDKYSLIDFADALIENEGDFQKTLNQLEKWAKHDNTGELQELFDDISLLDAEVGNNLLGEANLYSVTIHKDKTPDQYTWLEWDKPVTERQKEAVRRVFDEITNNEPDYHKASELSNQFAKYDFEGKTGEDIYREISDALWSDKYKPKGDSDKRASLLLLKNGIDGIKYPAESIARGTTSDNARGFNYVVFDENAVSIDEHIRFRIGNKRKADMKAGLLNKLTNATEEQVERTISEIEKLGEDVKAGGDSKTEKVAYHWALKGTVILPEDNDKILQAIKVAEISKVNPMEYNSPMELINNHDHIKLKEKPIDPDTVHTLTNKKDLGNGITIYNVEESEDSRENMRKIINTHLGNKRSPWCLLQGDENGNLTEQSAKYWKYYNGIPKRVAFYEGRLIAFSANDSNNVVWWDKQDKPTKGIPITHKIPNDELERTGTTEYNEETGLYGEYSNIHRGNKENGLYEKWYDNGQMWVRTTYKDGERNGLYEEWHDNGQMFMRTTLLDNYINGLYERWYYNGQMFMRGTFKDDGKRDGLYEEWYDNGQIKTRAIYKDGERKLLPTDVSLQELVDRGELDKKYLYDENEGEGVLFRRENANKQSSESKTLEEYKSKFENPKDIITFALEENTISYGSKQKANETLRETVRNITETGKLRDDSGRKYILHDNNAQSGSKEPDSVIKKVTKRTVLKDFKESGIMLAVKSALFFCA
jgi:antitoxin component YwqK of YwqJK toxin-antitoxin module